MANAIVEILSNPAFWVVWAGLGLLAWVAIRSTVNKLPFLGKILDNQQTFVIIGLIGLGVATGFLSSMGFSSTTASLAKTTSTGIVISDMQVTTNFASDGGCSIAADSMIDDLMHVRCTDLQANETASVEEVDTGIITVRRVGNLAPASCTVSASTPTFGSEDTPGDGNLYKIIEETTQGDLEVYLASGGAAALTSAKESTVLVFADGDADQTLGVMIEVDEEASDVIAQYSYRDVTLNVCGKPFIFRMHRMD